MLGIMTNKLLWLQEETKEKIYIVNSLLGYDTMWISATVMLLTSIQDALSLGLSWDPNSPNWDFL
jgi:hypothetical protein